MRLDILIRLIPLTVAPLVFSWFTGTPLAAFGLSFAHTLRDVVISIPLGLAGFAIATAFASYLGRRSGRWFVPTVPDLTVKRAYSIVLYAPLQAWVFRGFVLWIVSRLWLVGATSC